MDLETGVKLAQLAFVAAQASILVIIFLMKGTFATKKELAAEREANRETRHQVELQAERMKALPSFESHNKLRDVVNEVAASLRELKAEVKSIDEKSDDQKVAIARVERHLLNQVS